MGDDMSQDLNEDRDGVQGDEKNRPAQLWSRVGPYLTWSNVDELTKRILRGFSLVLLLVFIYLGIKLTFSIVDMDTRLGRPRTVTEVDTLIRANERLLQLIQWTVSTVLIIGGGLLGLNWYQNQQRYQRDMDEMEHRFQTAAEGTEYGFQGYREELNRMSEGWEERIERLEHRDLNRLGGLFTDVVIDVELASGPSETYGALAVGYVQLLEAEAPDRELTALFLEETLPLLRQEIDYSGDVVIVDDEDGEQRYAGFLEEVAAEFPSVHDAAIELIPFVRFEEQK